MKRPMVKKDMLVGMRLSLFFMRHGVTCRAVCELCPGGDAQQLRTVQVCVRDQGGSAIAGAKIQLAGVAGAEAVSDAGGCAQVAVGPGVQGTVQVTHDGFASVTQPLGTSPELTVVMQVAQTSEVVNVTGDADSAGRRCNGEQRADIDRHRDCGGSRPRTRRLAARGGGVPAISQDELVGGESDDRGDVAAGAGIDGGEPDAGAER